MVLSAEPVTAPDIGVRKARVEIVEERDLRCFYSRIENLNDAGKDDALQFHQVIASIFTKVAVIPFRFPMMVETEAELRGFLQEHAAEYSDALTRLRDAVQLVVVKFNSFHVSAFEEFLERLHELLLLFVAEF